MHLRHRSLLLFAIAAFLIGAALRLSYPNDIEYKGDERWMFERTQEVAAGEAWPAVGMRSSEGVVNPGLSVWIFIGLQKLSGADDPVRLARAVQVLNIVAILFLFLFISIAIPPGERVGWLWGAALICVNPLDVLLARKIWAQSVLPLFAMLVVVGWWYRKRHPAAVFLWGFAGALLGQIHMAGFFVAAAVAIWTLLFDRERKAIAWSAWVLGTVLGSLGLIPWFIEATQQLGNESSPFHISALVNFKWWNYWISNSTGVVMRYTLGQHFWTFLEYPMVGGRATYLVAALHVVLLLCSFYVARLAIILLKERRGRWRDLFVGRASELSLIISSYLWGCGILMTAAGVAIARHYLLVAFPLASVWFARFLARDARPGRWVFGAMWMAQLLVTMLFLHYIHVNGGAPNGTYGVVYSATGP